MTKPSAEKNHYIINDIVEFHPSNRTLIDKKTGSIVVLQTPASLVFHYLIDHKGDITSQKQLIKEGWSAKKDITSVNTLYQTILFIRNTLENIGLSREIIKTIPRKGIFISDEVDIIKISLLTPLLEEQHAIDESSVKKSSGNLFGEENLVKFFFVSLFFVGVILFCVIYFSPSESFFSSYRALEKSNVASCSLFYNSDILSQQDYINFIHKNSVLCNNNFVFLSGAKSVRNISALVCPDDIRENPSIKCITYYSIKNEY